MKLELSENAINLLEKRYLQRDVDRNLIEEPKEMFYRVAANVASAEEDETKEELYREKFIDLMTQLKFLPNSPTLMNAGTELQQLAACFVLPVEDSMEGIFSAVKNAALIHKSGGGTGFSFSRLRPKDDVVKTTGGVSSGPLSFLEVFNSATNTVKQGGKRRGANMGVLRVDHPDIIDFINAKGELDEKNEKLYQKFEAALEDAKINPELKENRLEDYRRELLDNQFSNFNLSVGITEEFMEAVKNNTTYNLINPRTGEVVDKLDANEVFTLIIEYGWKNGEPGIVFLDKINEDHPLNLEVEATNPCGEQPLLPNEACNLGSINLPKFVEDGEVDWDALRETIRLAVRFLDDVITVNEHPLVEIEEQVEKYRKIGLGVMGFHELIIRLDIAYNSNEAVAMAEKVMKFINETAQQYSRELAEEKGAFPGFSESVYEKPQRNATLTTIAPTGSISFLGGTSGGIEPFFSFKYSHTDADGNVSWFEYDFTDQVNEEVLVTAMDIEPQWHVKVQAAFQKYVDNAVSKTINFPNNATKKDIRDAYLLAHQLDCKGLTVYRDGSRNVQVLEDDTESTVEVESGAEEENHDKIYPNRRPLLANGRTIRYNTGCGKLYLTVNFNEDGEPIETFLTTGSDGGCQVMTEGVSRLTSLALRSGIAPKEIIDQLESTTTCPSFMYQKGKGENLEGRSCPDVVARVLKQIVATNGNGDALNELEKRQENGFDEKVELNQFKIKNIDLTNDIDEHLCPECGEMLHFEEGCDNCKNCGYSSCG